jgi:hypothetical protein
MFNVQSSAPKESLFIETGKLTVKHIIKMRRVMYWWHLVNLDKMRFCINFILVRN